MPIQGVLNGLPLVLPVFAELTTPAILAFEVVASLLVGALLVAYFATRAPRVGSDSPRPQLPERREPRAASDDEGAGEGATVPGAVTRCYAPPPSPAAPPAVASDDLGPSLLDRLRSALGKSRAALQERFDALLGRAVDASALDELEEALLLADVGVETAMELVDDLRVGLRQGLEGPALRERLRDGIRSRLEAVHQPLAAPGDGLFVVLVVGVNGSGKTTTIGKLASRYRSEGKKVLLAAADTYRAAAADQLAVWAERAEVELVRLDEGADPGAVVYQAMERAIAKSYDVLIIDTAGRLQTRKPLMEELAKLRRVIGKHLEDAPHETLLVLDGTMGQNGLSQASLFHEATPLTGVVITKLDGTAKGGMVLTIASEMALPVKLIGIGEKVDDLRDFNPSAFVDVLA